MKFNDLSEYDKGYIAAFLDGEGSLCISKHESGHYRLAIAFYNTHEETMIWLSKILGTYIHTCTKDKRDKYLKNKICYAVTIKKQADSLEFLVSILPYLKIKHNQCINCINFLKIILDRDNYKLSDEDIIKMKECYDLNRFYNKGGQN